jgi:TetR/AcrR family transcriptional regulator, fatty acid metabolism regulator protein
MLDTISGVESLEEPARETLRKVAAIVLRAWRDTPDVVRVLVREVTRSPHLQQEIGETEQAFSALERIIRTGQESGEFREDVDPRFASFIFYGALEEILTGWVMGQLPDKDEDVRVAEQTVVEMLCDGLLAASPATA